MDRQISTDKQRKQSRSKLLRYGMMILVLIAVVFGVRHLLRTSLGKDNFLTAEVRRGNIENTITAVGTVVPAFEEQVNAPIATQIKEVYLTSGKEVKPGDKIMQLNQDFIKLQYGSVSDKLELRRNNISKLKLEFDKNINDLDYDSQIQALQIADMEAQLQDALRLEKIGGATTEDVERARLKLEIARLEKKKLENELNFRRAVVANDRRNLELELQIDEKELSELRQKLAKTEVTAPRAGVITWVNESIGQQVNEGDPLARIADLNRFRIEASCSDRYSDAINVGMPVRVRINDRQLPGEISAVLPAAVNNTVQFIVELTKPDDTNLKPDMRTEVYVIAGQKEDVLLVNNGAAFRGGKEQYIYQIEGEKAVRKTVRIGMTNRDFVELEGNNFREGDRIIVSDTKPYEHLREIDL